MVIVKVVKAVVVVVVGQHTRNISHKPQEMISAVIPSL
jgi:hypothetical protein